jgi:hypothetical protein
MKIISWEDVEGLKVRIIPKVVLKCYAQFQPDLNKMELQETKIFPNLMKD